MKLQQSKNIICLLLTLLLLPGLLPAASLAEEGDIGDIVIVETGDEMEIVDMVTDERSPAELPEELRPFYGGIYSWLRLELNKTLLEQVGHQSGGRSCACFSLAYARTLLDGEAYAYSDFNMGHNEFDAYCDWYAGSYDSYSYTATYDVYERMYRELVAGHPTMVLIHGSRTAHHYVTVVGFEKVETGVPLSAGNFLILDPCAPDFEPRNMGAAGFRPKRDEYGRYQLLCDLSSATVAHEEHRSSFLSYCSFTETARLLRARRAVAIRALPSSTLDLTESRTLALLRAGQSFRVTALVKNRAGEYWYRGVSETGEAGYVPAGRFDEGVSLLDGVRTRGLKLPSRLRQGETFTVEGAVCAGRQAFSSLRLDVYAEGEENGVLYAVFDRPCWYCSLSESGLSDALRFRSLTPGTYRLVLTATVRSGYSTDGKTLKTDEQTLCLAERLFTVEAGT